MDWYWWMKFVCTPEVFVPIRVGPMIVKGAPYKLWLNFYEDILAQVNFSYLCWSWCCSTHTVRGKCPLQSSVAMTRPLPTSSALLFCPSITNKTLRKPNPNIHIKSKWFLRFFPASIPQNPQNPQNRPLMNHFISLISLTGITYLLKILEFATVPQVILLLEKQPARKLIM